MDADPGGIPRILADLADGHLNEEETEAVLAWLSAAAGLEPPAPWLVNRAVRLGRQASADQHPRPVLWRRVVATLVRDTRRQPRPVGARALGHEPTRLLYEAGAVQVDLEVTASGRPGQRCVRGHVLAGALDLMDAWAVAQSSSARIETDLDELGQFSLEDIATGVYCLDIGLASQLVEVNDVQV
jgi:hypothetical protein